VPAAVCWPPRRTRNQHQIASDHVRYRRNRRFRRRRYSGPQTRQSRTLLRRSGTPPLSGFRECRIWPAAAARIRNSRAGSVCARITAHWTVQLSAGACGGPAVKQAWIDRLKRGDRTETPAGSLSVHRSRSGRRRLVFEPADLQFGSIVVAKEGANMTSPQNEDPPTRCRRCGSDWFTELEFRQYDARSYTLIPTRTLQSLSDPHPALACVCGIPFQTKRPARGRRLEPEAQSFQDSWQKARNYLAQQSEGEARISERLQSAREYVAELVSRIERAERSVADLGAEIKGRHLKPKRRMRVRSA
jgi:hypothetical protein